MRIGNAGEAWEVSKHASNAKKQAGKEPGSQREAAREAGRQRKWAMTEKHQEKGKVALQPSPWQTPTSLEANGG